jgi:hypothetical protein
MLLKYFHNSILLGHLGALKTFQKTAVNFYWSKMRVDISEYIHCCILCQRAKQAQFTRVGLHSASPISGAMERLFIDFMGTLTQSKQGNVAILVVWDAFSKSVSFPLSEKFCPRMCVWEFEEGLFPFIWYASFHSDRVPRYSAVHKWGICVFSGELPTRLLSHIICKVTHGMSQP